MFTKALSKAILALHATAHLERGKELPSRLLICPWGATDTNKGRIVCNATTLAQLPRNNARAKRDRVALDFNHNTVEGSATYKGEPAKVAAWGNFEVVAGEGIYLSALEWTAEGQEHAAGGHYPDISPAIVPNEAGEIIFLHSAGLARQGEIDGVTLFSAPAITVLIQTFNSDPTAKKSMDPKALLLAILGLPETATDEEIKAAADALGEKLKPKGADNAEVKAMSARIAALEEGAKTFAATASLAQRKDITDRAAREGKVIPLTTEQIATLPVETFSALVDGLPVTVPLEKRTGVVKEFSAGVNVSPEADTIRANMGVSKEAYDKFTKV